MYRSARQIFGIILIMIISMTASAENTQQTIKMGMDIDYQPFSFIDKNVPVGLDIDIIAELNRYLPQKVDVKLDKWSTVQSDLDTGKLDAVAGLLYSEERAKIYDFTMSYNSEPAVIFISKKITANTVQDLYDKKMADLRGNPFPESIIIEHELSKAFDSYDTFSEVFFSLETGKADFTIAPYSVGMEIINKHGYNNVISMGPNVAMYQYRIAVKKGNAELLGKLNMAIEKMHKTDFDLKNKRKWIKYENNGITWVEFVKFTLFILVPVIILILTLAIYILKREIARKTMLLQEQNEELTKLAMVDPGTELYNRRRFYELAESRFANSKKSGSIFGLLMIDLDWFKKINDKYGHDVGDIVILHFAEHCKKYFRSQDIVCRYGGEEFIVLLPMTDEKRVLKVAERIRQVIYEDEIIIGDGKVLKYTVSIGIAIFNQDDEKLAQIIKRADNALYQAKEEGRNCIAIMR